MSGADIRAGGAFVEVFAKNENLKKGLEEAKKQLSNFQQSVNRVGGALGNVFGKGSGISRGIQNAFSGVGAAIERGFLRGVEGSKLFLGSMRAVELKMRNFSVSARNLGLDLIKLGVVLGTPIAIGVKQFADFEKALAKVSTFLSEPAKFIPSFKKDILDLSEQFGTSATEIADGLAEILSAGIPASKAMNFVKDSLKGSIGNVVAFKDQMSLLITVMQAYEGSNLTTAKATEILRVIVEKGRIPADQLAQSFGQVVSRAAQAGVSFEELAAAQSAMSLTGLTVAEQTTALNGVIAAFSGSSPEAKEAFKELDLAIGGTGETMSLATLRANGLTATIEKLAKLSPDDLMKVFKDRRAGNGIIILTSKIKEYKDALDAARSGSGLADSALLKMTKTLTMLGSKLLEVGKNLAIQFGEVLLDSLTSAANALIDIGKLISEFIKNNPTLALTLAKVAAAILAAGAAFVSLGLGFSVLSTVLSGFVAVGTLVVDAIVFISGALAGLFLFFTSGTGVIVAIGAILIGTFTDFGAVIGSVVGSVKNSFRGLMGVFSNFKNGVVETFDLVKRAVAAKDYDLAVRIIVNKIKTIWYEAIDSITAKYEELKASFVAKINEMRITFVNFIVNILKTISTYFNSDLFSDFGVEFKRVFSRLDGTLLGFKITWNNVWGEMQKFALNTLKLINDKWNDFIKISGLVTQKVTFARTESDINIAQGEISKAVGTDKVGLALISQIKLMAQSIQENTEMLEDPAMQGSNRKIVEDVLAASTQRFKEATIELAEKFNLGSDYLATEIKKVREAFTPLNSFDQHLADLLNATEVKQGLDDRNNKNENDAIDAETKAKNFFLDLGNLIDKGGNAWEKFFGKDTSNKAQLSELEKEKSTFSNEIKNAEFKNKVQDLINSTGDFIRKAFEDRGDAKVPNDKKDREAVAKIEEQKIRDGIMGAFNTNALGDFSKGDVMKSQLELLKEANDRLKEIQDRVKEALVPAKETAVNTKEKALFK